MDHYYIFYVDANGLTTYDRTCGTKDRAQEVVDTLKKTYPDAFYTLNALPEDFYY